MGSVYQFKNNQTYGKVSEPFHPELNLPPEYLQEDFDEISEEQKMRLEYYRKTVSELSRTELEEAFMEILEQLYITGGRVSWLEGYASEK